MFLSLGVLLEDFLVVVVGIVIACAGIVLEIVAGSAAVKGVGKLL